MFCIDFSLFYCCLYLNMILSSILLIVNVSQLNWLSCQIFGISKQALDFVRDGEILRPRWKFGEKKKCHFLTTPPLENGLVQEILHLGNLWRTKVLVTFDSFHGRERIPVDFMIFCVTDGRNANTELITLFCYYSTICKQCLRWSQVRLKESKLRYG